MLTASLVISGDDDATIRAHRLAGSDVIIVTIETEQNGDGIVRLHLDEDQAKTLIDAVISARYPEIAEAAQ